jgi:hypothetical protein
MHQDISQQSPGSGSSAAYCPHVPAGLKTRSASSSRGHAAAIAGLGLMIVAAVAFTGCRAQPAASPKPSSTASVHPPSPAPLAASVMPAPSLVNQLEEQKKSAAVAPLPRPVSLTSIRKSPAVKKEQSVPKALPVKRISVIHETVARRLFVAPNPPAAPAPRVPPAPPAALDIPTPAAARPFFVGIEGDLTVASYDEAGGTVETYEGSNFVLDPGTADSDGIPWQDFPFIVHYRCEESGKCILVRGSAKVMARMSR